MRTKLVDNELAIYGRLNTDVIFADFVRCIDSVSVQLLLINCERNNFKIIITVSLYHASFLSLLSSIPLCCQILIFD